MAGSKGQKYNIGPPVTEFLKRTNNAKKYFFLDGKLYKIIWQNRAQDLLRAWSFEDEAVVQFIWSHARRHMQQAFNTLEVAKLLNRNKRNVLLQVARGNVKKPYKIYTQESDSERTEFGLFKWSEDDVLELHSFYLTGGNGRPRKDGMIRSAPRIPTRLELLAMMKQNRMIYIQDQEGNFVPVFEQPDWT